MFGLPRRRVDQVRDPIGTTMAPGSPNVFKGRLVIVFGPSGSVVGVFVYAAGATPGPGTGPIAWLTSSSTDPFGNPVSPPFGTRSAINGSTQIAGGIIALSPVVPGSAAAQLAAPVAGELQLSPGLVTGLDTAVGLLLLSKAASPSGVSVVQVQAGPVVATHPGTANPETWQNVALGGITIPNGGGTPTGRLRYQLRPTNEVTVDCNISFANTTAQGSVNLFTAATGYVPANAINWPSRVFTGTAPTNNELTGGVTAGGVVFINNIPTGSNNLAFYQDYALD